MLSSLPQTTDSLQQEDTYQLQKNAETQSPGVEILRVRPCAEECVGHSNLYQEVHGIYPDTVNHDIKAEEERITERKCFVSDSGEYGRVVLTDWIESSDAGLFHEGLKPF